MRLYALLTALLFALAGCASDDEPLAEEDTPMDDEPMEEEMPIEDFGEYTLDPNTGQCDAADYTEAGAFYYSEIGGGNWVFQESNGIPGLQYEDNHIGSSTGTVFTLPVDGRCTNGDQAVA